MKKVRKFIARQLNRLANRLSPTGAIYVDIVPRVDIKARFSFGEPRKLQARVRVETFYEEVEKADALGMLTEEQRIQHYATIREQAINHLEDDILRAASDAITYRTFRDEDGKRCAEAFLYIIPNEDK